MTPRPAKQDMPVVILCGGQGTRLREETETRPKPMVEIGGRPILWHILKHYGHHGFRRFILCLGYKGWVIKEYFLRFHEQLRDFTVTLDGSRPLEYHDRRGSEPWSVTCAETGAETATGARLWRVKDYIDTDSFCFTYGDAVSDVDLDRLLDLHHAEGRIGTVTGVHPTSRYGELRVDQQRVVDFDEKPVAEGVVSGGFFVFQKAIFEHMNDDPGLVLEHGPLRELSRRGQMSVHLHEGFWHPMDTYRDYLHLNSLWKGAGGSAGSDRAPWKTWKED